MIRDFEKSFVAPDATILAAMEAINASEARVALVVDGEKRLLGSITDGDIRRALLSGFPLSGLASAVMNREPKIIREGDDRSQAIDLMQRNICRQVPVLDQQGRVTGIESFEDAVLSLRRDNWVVLLAGGRGTRLLPLTAERPKPMLHVGNQPILATIIDNLKKQGFTNIFIAINYKGEMIRSYFGDGADRNVNIRYLVEEESLGTAGALSLLPEIPTEPMVVMNGDILTTVDLKHLLDFHQDHGAAGTMCVSQYSFEVPFGVVDVDKHRVTRISEKPVYRFLVSAGIYVLQPEAVQLVPSATRYDMPSLFERLIGEGRETCVFPIGEYWMDIGRMDDFERANRDYSGHFAPPPEQTR
jgi:dTDP-glucose pyrophosphorylase